MDNVDVIARIANLADNQVDSIKQLEQRLSELTGARISLIAYELERRS